MATVSLLAQPEKLECCQCRDGVKDRLKTLPCGHSLCGQCVRGLTDLTETSPQNTVQSTATPVAMMTMKTTTTTTTTKATNADQSFDTTHALTKRPAAFIKIQPIPLGTSKGAAFRFHDNHGKNIVLSNNKQTAERKELGVLEGGGVVVSHDPMQVNKLYEVRLDREAGCRWPLAVGVMTSQPDSLTWQFGSFWEDSAIFVHQSYVIDRHRYTETKVGKDLKELPADSRVGVSVDVSRRLHLYVNGQHQGVVPCSALPDPCYALFELRHTNGLRGNSIRVTALPVTSLT